MKDVLQGAISGAVDQLLNTRQAMQEPEALTRQEQRERYERFHMGRPLALIQWAKKSAPPGTDPLAEAQRYQDAMEELRRQK